MNRIICIILVLILSNVSYVQSAEKKSKITSGSDKTSLSNPYTGKQWEYLVVSFGKVLFSDPTDTPELKTKGLSKLVSYSKLGVVSASEALTTQFQMDTLGKFGWELIGVVGAIAGDQELLFKRPFNPGQSKLEAALIKREGEILLAGQNAEAIKLANKLKSKVDLVDLDAAERAEAIDKNRRSQEDRLKKSIAEYSTYPIMNVTVRSSADSPTSTRVRADIIVDGSAVLLKDGNSYRKSEAELLAKKVTEELSKIAGIQKNTWTDEVQLAVSIKVSYRGASEIVAEESVHGKY